MRENYVTRTGRTLRCGYTTGSCAAGAAKAAAEMLFSRHIVESVTLTTPGGAVLSLGIHDPFIGADYARCAVQKDSGDDPDITNGILVYARVHITDSGLLIEGGEGVGHVTREGLDQLVGAAAINSTPRRMIAEAVKEVCGKWGYQGGLRIVISIPGGEALAAKTFNPRLGIVGGLSVLGTTGIVEPMSSAALVDTIRLELRVLAAAGENSVLLCPGNYGEAFSREMLRLDLRNQVTVSNFIGDAIDEAVQQGFQNILLIGHIGKLVKLGLGFHNTHSIYGDGRMETLVACALESGANVELLRRILHAATTDAALGCIHGAGLLAPSMSLLGERIQAHLERKVPLGVEIGFICFTNAEPVKGVLMKSANADRLLDRWRAHPVIPRNE